jgi:DNA repair protein RecO (recombination protein O)
MLYRVEGIVIRSIPYGESHTIISLLTQDHGKIGVMVRGAKKPKSRLAAVTQLYTYGEFVFFRAGAQTLGSLNQGELLDTYRHVRNDVRLSTYAVYFAELVDRMVTDEEASTYHFSQLKAALEALDQGKDPQIVGHMLEMKCFHCAGITPSLSACAACRHAITGDEPIVGWSSLAGGLLCLQCDPTFPDRMIISITMMKLLQRLLQTDLRNLGDVRVRQESKNQLKLITRQWMHVHADLHLKSRLVLDQIEESFIP